MKKNWVRLVLFTDENQILVMKINDRWHHELFGGEVLDGETPEQALKRWFAENIKAPLPTINFFETKPLTSNIDLSLFSGIYTGKIESLSHNEFPIRAVSVSSLGPFNRKTDGLGNRTILANGLDFPVERLIVNMTNQNNHPVPTTQEMTLETHEAETVPA
ncbi:MAG: hypothetical protein G01um101418_199 [Parcubacteria group bacterium Gr01-1014_18]|nr:MAG: hypothetical protein Greene041636_167 [Parcubacteria group bacterium Greene0416_36]TSC81359.1 MAG: hypothetical protein G01um101418_199 [Parcubacteria group bacterium Gr01-1014_18]TSC99455.1 MAG: hypothetical protein Greene101420_122 [Parcubacteria group bacterium Greene1014_20]TSD07626.1 MAG: hypothetical protein Greene07142_83 [Parcubacteria group bacterium Greene0714_2]